MRGSLLFGFRFFFFNDTATTEIYTLSLHDALPICWPPWPRRRTRPAVGGRCPATDRKSTRLNSSHHSISYAVFCLKKKKNKCQCPTPPRLPPHALPLSKLPPHT